MAHSRRDRCLTLYRVAVRADRMFDKAIKKVAGKRATRWTITRAQNAHPVIRRAYKRKVAVDMAVHRAYRSRT